MDTKKKRHELTSEERQRQQREAQLKWFNDFADYVENASARIYASACEYADERESSRLGV